MGGRGSRLPIDSRIVIGSGLALLVVGGTLQCSESANSRSHTIATTQYARIEAVRGYAPPDPTEAIARDDPLRLLRQVGRDYEGRITDYTCTLAKQERIQGVLGPEEVIAVKYREQPFSVLMEWVRNPRRCDRLLYVKGKWKGKSGGEEAWVDPHGTVVDVVLGSRGGIRYDIHKAVTEGKTLRAVDMFGFVNMLGRIVSVSERAAERGELELAYLGKSRLGDRETYLFERTLPYTGEPGGYPERVLLLHLDRQLRVPVGIFSFGDDAREYLLSSYVITDIVMNPGLSPVVFSKESNGF